MNTKISLLAFLQLAIFHVTNSQCINRILGPNVLPETILPNQMLYPPNYIGSNIFDYPFDITPNAMLPGQILPNVLPGQILPNVLPGQFSTNVLPGQLLPGQILPGQILPGSVLPNVIQSPTIIQDSSVANNLANALQLLVVSNLLANTLPQNEVVVPNYPPFEFLSPHASGPCGMRGYSYIY